MKAIRTRYLSATNFKPSRIVADAAPYYKNRVVTSYDDGLSSSENHSLAAYRLAHTRNWAGVYVSGHLMGETVWVNLGFDATVSASSLSNGETFKIERT